MSMRKANEKLKWAKPKLIALVRGGPAEAVLMTCKSHDFCPGIAGPGYAWVGNDCSGDDEPCGPCYQPNACS